MMKLDIRAYLRSKFGARISQSGVNWAVPCPDCDTKWRHGMKAHLYVQVEDGRSVCYRCAESGSGKYHSLPDLIASLEGIGYTEALRFIKDSSDRVWETVEPVVEDDPRPIALPSEYKSAWGFPLPKMFEAFFKKRGVDEQTRRAYRIGYAETGFYKDRVIVPVILRGGVWSFVARDVTGKAKQKILDPKGARKSMLLFNIDRVQPGTVAVVTEGVWDAMRVGVQGVAVLGSTLSDSQLCLLKDAQPGQVVVMLDPDAQDKAVRMADRLQEHFPQVKVVELEADPDEYARKALWDRIRATPLRVNGVVGRLRNSLG